MNDIIESKNDSKHSQEKIVSAPWSGWFSLACGIVLTLLAGWWGVSAFNAGGLILGGLSLCALVAACLFYGGLIIIPPQHAVVMTFFGNYVGTVKRNGFFFVCPFYGKQTVGLQFTSLETAKLKVNDKKGNPIEIAAIVLYRVSDTAKAVFDVSDCVKFAALQSESATRHLAQSFAYDHADSEDEVTLLRNADEVNKKLEEEVTQRFLLAGLVVEESRLSHLAYAPEIAQAMLKRQQASAILAARETIVTGAVSIVEKAIGALTEKKTVELSSQEKGRLASNLLVVICGDAGVQPVVSVGGHAQ